MLYSILKKCELTTPIGEKIGKITDLLVDTRETPWTVKKITLKTRRMLGKSFAYPIDHVGKVDKTQKNVRVKGYVEPETAPTLSKVDMMYLGDLKKTAVTEDDEKIGKIYNFDVSTLTKPWTVEKVLIKTGTRKRRLKISVDRVKTIEKNVTIKPE